VRRNKLFIRYEVLTAMIMKIASTDLVSHVACSSTLKMEATCFSETSVDFQRIHGSVSQRLEFLHFGDCTGIFVCLI
jgi:hypothetical protein